MSFDDKLIEDLGGGEVGVCPPVTPVPNIAGQEAPDCADIQANHDLYI